MNSLAGLLAYCDALRENPVTVKFRESLRLQANFRESSWFFLVACAVATEKHVQFTAKLGFPLAGWIRWLDSLAGFAGCVKKTYDRKIVYIYKQILGKVRGFFWSHARWLQKNMFSSQPN